MKEKGLQGLRMGLLRRLLDMFLLVALKHEPLSGYDLMSLLSREFGLVVSSGTIYSNLYTLEREAYVEGVSDGKRRIYRLTQLGSEKVELFNNAGRELGLLFAKLDKPTGSKA